MTQGLARVEELFEARNPKVTAEISDIDGVVEEERIDKNTIVRVVAHELEEEEYYFGDQFEVAVKVGQTIKPKQILARNKKERQRITSAFG
jgi:DNA-directed RNA polymerase subunit beta'